jgi:hypothetical protein
MSQFHKSTYRNPFNGSRTISSNITLLRPSNTIKNNKGDTGHPCLNPIVGEKNFVDPLIKIENDIEERHQTIKFTIGKHTPLCKNIILRYNDLMLS